MLVLTTGAAAFFVLHRLVSGGPLREPLVQRLGDAKFQRLFALASLACLAWLTAGYWLAREQFSLRLWPIDMPTWLEWLLHFLAVCLIAAGLITPNPATAGMLDAVRRPDVVRGMLRITRHPFLWGVAIMALTHVLARPDPATLAYFGTLALLALSGTLSIDRKRYAQLGGDWAAFVRCTSNVPFAAVLAGKQTLRLNEIGFRTLMAASGLYVVLVLAHLLVARTLE